MKVLHVICDLSGGGAERLVLNLCTHGLRGQEVATVQGGGPLHREFAAAGIPVHLGNRRPGTLGLGALPHLRRLLPHFDVLHTHLFAGDTWGRIAALAHRIPVVTTEHNINRDEQRHHRAIKRVLAPRSDRLVFVSEAARDYAEHVERICHPEVRVIPNGVDLDRFAGSRTPAGSMHLLGVGRDAPQKGWDWLIRSLPAGVSLSIAGESNRRGQRGAVTWLGPQDDVPALLRGADVLVVPSLWEGFGLAAVEGMAAGVPVIASRVGGLVEVVGDAGVLVPAGDEGAMRAAILGLRDPERRAQLGEAGRVRARRFSLGACVEAYTALYREVVNR